MSPSREPRKQRHCHSNLMKQVHTYVLFVVVETFPRPAVICAYHRVAIFFSSHAVHSSVVSKTESHTTTVLIIRCIKNTVLRKRHSTESIAVKILMNRARCVDELCAVSDLFIYGTKVRSVLWLWWLCGIPVLANTVPDGKILIFSINIIRLSDITNHWFPSRVVRTPYSVIIP